MTDLNANKDLVRAFVAAWNDRDFDRFDELMGHGAVLNVGGTAVSCDPAGTRTIADEWTTAFPDWRFELLRLVAEGDWVAAHMPYSGTFTSPILGVACLRDPHPLNDAPHRRKFTNFSPPSASVL